MKKGFTLIELMVGIGLVTVITSFGVASFRTSSRRQAVDTAADRLRQVLLQARSNALYGKKECTGGPLDGWRVVVVGRTVVLENVCVGNIISRPLETFAGTTVSVSPNATILFKPIGQGIENGSALSTMFSVADSSISYTKTITVTQKGDVN